MKTNKILTLALIGDSPLARTYAKTILKSVKSFNLKYKDPLEGWATGTASGNAYTTQNQPATVKSQGLELISKWHLNNLLNFDFNYTYTSTYDGAEQDDPDNSSSQYNAQMARVPRHILNLNTNLHNLLRNKMM